MSDLRLPDQSSRTDIDTDLDTNLLVEAGAGSGKTRSLLRRMVGLIRSGVATAPEIAAVTFTRKAAGELRERFQQELESELDSAEPESEERARLNRALSSLDQLFIGTIHAFCARLLRERPLEAGLDPGFQELTDEASSRFTSKFWAAHLERLNADGDPVLGALSDVGLHPRQLERLFREVSEQPDVEFPTDDIPRPDGEAIAAVREELILLMRQAEEMMPEAEPPKGWDDIQKKVVPLRYSLSVIGWDTEIEFYRAVSEVARKGSYKATQNKWSDDPDIKVRAKALGKAFSSFVAADSPAQRLLLQWRMHRYGVAIRMVVGAAASWEGERRRTGRLNFQDLLMMTVSLLRSSRDARRQLGLRYRRVLVDEFQDTDPVQAEILMLLAAEPSEDQDGGPPPETAHDVVGHEHWLEVRPRPGALFVVGDPKQSIYRFRCADITVYNAVKERFEVFGRVLGLSANFRSVPGVAALVNDVFDQQDTFPATATAYQAAFAPLLPQRAPRAGKPDGVSYYTVEETARVDLVAEDAIRLASWISERCGTGGDRRPGDFLILTKYRKDLEPYAKELEARGLPVALSGVALGQEEEITELVGLLECLVDPTDSVKVAAVLVGLFFGLDFEQLLDHRVRGGRFTVTSVGNQPETEVTQALRRLNRWWEATRRAPADGVLASIVDELGLLPHVAAGPLGQIRSGALLYLLDAVSSSALDGSTSIAGALEAVRLALDAKEPEAPLQPGRTDAVRIMNIHKAKGLQAPVVVLAAPVSDSRRDPEHHIARREDGTAAGYLVVQTREKWSRTIHAMPPDWFKLETEEDRFADAEAVRLMYVAATRAEDELIVARRGDRKSTSPWALFDAWLDEHGTQLDSVVAQICPPRAVLEEEGRAVRNRGIGVEVRRGKKSRPGYSFRPVTSEAKTTVPVESQMALDMSGPGGEELGSAELAAGPAEIEKRSRGFSWGTVVHGALAVAAGGLEDAELRAVGRGLLVENERPLDAYGEPHEVDELVALVNSVYGSPLWKRARSAEEILVEVPFSTRVPALESSEDPGRADSKRYVEGVIDLAFREADGWTIADYKTDVGTDPEFPIRQASYRRQVELYAQCWTQLTEAPIKERIILYTAQLREETW
jgi:ATP-dependent helicase/nuclease subunit A